MWPNPSELFLKHLNLRKYAVLALIVLSLHSFSQVNLNPKSDKASLAIQFYEQKEYEKAAVYFGELFNDNPTIWFSHYYNTLLELKDYSKAEKITKKVIKKNKSDYSYYVLLGKVYGLSDQKKKENDAYEKAIKEMTPSQPFVSNLAQAFINEKLYDLALEVYDRAAKANKDYPYLYEKAEVYKMKGDITKMINAYLDAVEFRDSELYTAQTHLQNSLGYDDEHGGLRNPILKQELQKRIQASPDKTIFAEFLIFILKQQKDFDGAFVQSRALDKRNKEDGRRIYDLAKICQSNKAWETAIRCYEYLIDKNGFYAESAKIEILSVEFQVIAESPNPSEESIKALESKMAQAMEAYKGTSIQNLIIGDYAKLKAYYLNKPDEAIAILDEVVTNPGLKPIQRAEFKILQADIYLLTGQIWDASLLYSQVEKDFKFEPIGHEAKFKNAKLSFYAGDFKWAKTQCDVLKGATTKLIANDALDLSLIITDAIGIDTNDIPLKMYASADLMEVQHRYADALNRLDSINLLFKDHTLGDDIYYKKAEIFMKQNKYKEALEMYKNIIEYYPTELYGDDAQFKIAELYEEKLNDKEKAKTEYENLIVNYPGSIYVVEARKRYRALRGENLNN